jgi:hypothetical protein
MLYRTQQCEIGEIIKYLYRIALNDIQRGGDKSSISRQDLIFH